jgi:glycine/D-amino acid oxidase-like deaminating enzyme
MRKLRVGRSIWLPSAPPQRFSTFPRLRGRHDADVAIVGGGITGATIAAAFASAGVRAAVVEAQLIGRGSTAASTALLLRRPDAGAGALVERYGRRDGAKMWRDSERAAREFVATLRERDIDCDLTVRDSIYYARDAASASLLQRELACRHTLGADDDWIDRDALERTTGIRGHGAIKTHGDAQCNPYEACIGLMRWAAARGVAVFERTEATRITPHRRGVTIVSSHGTLSASYVVIATGYATAQFKPLVSRFRMKHTYVLATSPMRARERAAVGLGGVLVWDTDRPYHYARWTRDHRLLLGGGDRNVVPEPQRATAFRTATRELKAYFDTVLPALADVSIDCAWEGLFAATPDSFPYIGPHRRYPRHLFALGYGGNGMTCAALAARFLVAHCQGKPSADALLFAFARHR